MVMNYFAKIRGRQLKTNNLEIEKNLPLKTKTPRISRIKQSVESVALFVAPIGP
jgi:hypothetical protein